MCLTVYIASQNPLPFLPVNREQPAFCIYEIKDRKQYDQLLTIMGRPFIYRLGSSFGCGCGFYFGEDSMDEQSAADRARSVNDSMAMRQYLQKHLEGNDIRMLLTWWDNVYDNFPQQDFYLECINDRAFAFEEDILYTIRTII